MTVVSLLAVIGGCTSPVDSVDELVEAYLTGAFMAGDGTIIEADGSGGATIRTLGSTRSTFADFKVGGSYLSGLAPTGAEGGYRGYVMESDGLLGPGNVAVSGDNLTITRDNGRAPSGHSEWRRTASSSGGGGGGASGSTVLIYQKGLAGNERSSRYFTVTVPSGTKKLTVETFEENSSGGNLGDLFVSFGTQPTASRHPYTWTAQCASVQSNRAPETCTFTNPTAGTWHILLYGYHAYYETSLRATIEK